MPPAWQDAQRPLRAPRAHRNLEAVRRLPRTFRSLASIYDPAPRCSTMRSRHQNSRRALPRRRRPQEFRGHRRPRGLGPLPYSGDNCPRLHGAKRENHSFDSRFILGLQNSPFSPWGGRLVWFAFSFRRTELAAPQRASARFDFCNYIILCGCDKFRTGRRWPSAAKNDRRGARRRERSRSGAKGETDRLRFVLV
jgi:hypothetical protein